MKLLEMVQMLTNIQDHLKQMVHQLRDLQNLEMEILNG